MDLSSSVVKQVAASREKKDQPRMAVVLKNCQSICLRIMKAVTMARGTVGNGTHSLSKFLSTHTIVVPVYFGH